MKKHSNIPIFIPELACPHQCVFCNQREISGTHDVIKPAEIKDIVEKYLQTMNDGREIEIAFFGGSFTGIPIQLQEEYLKEAFEFVKSKQVSGIRLSTRPDYINENTLDLLKKYNVKAIELGAQSTNKEVLQKSERGHSFEDIVNASNLINQHGFELGLQMMIGLPGDSFEKSVQTAMDIINLGAKSTRIYPTLVVKNTALEKLYKEGKYKALSLEEAVNWSKELYKLFYENNVTILRVGLHPSEDLIEGKSLIAGPFHPSFKEMVLTEIWNDILIEKFKDLKIDKLNKISVFVNSKQLNYAIGYKQKNRILLQKKGFEVKFVGTDNLSNFNIELKL